MKGIKRVKGEVIIAAVLRGRRGGGNHGQGTFRNEQGSVIKPTTCEVNQEMKLHCP